MQGCYLLKIELAEHGTAIALYHETTEDEKDSFNFRIGS